MKKYTIELTDEEFKELQKDLGLTDEEIKAMSEEDLARHIISYKCRKTCRKLVKHAAEGSPKSKFKLANIKKLADAMYYAAQNITTDASRLHKAMDEYHQFIINEYHKEEPVSE